MPADPGVPQRRRQRMAAWPADRLRVYAADWLARRRPDLRLATWRRYQNILDLYILPHIGDVYLTSVTRGLVRDLCDVLRQRGGVGGRPLSPRSVRLVHAVLSALCHDAVEREHLAANPLQRMHLSRAAVRPRRVLDRAELAQFLAVAQQLFPRLHPIMATQAYAGLRIGEALALQRGDIALADGWLHVQRSVLQSGEVMPSPKNKTARYVVMADRLKPILAPVVAVADPWLFPGREVTVRQRTVLLAMARTATAAGLAHVPTHALRRTYGSILKAAGADILVLRDQYGHASVQQTEEYVGLLPPRPSLLRPFRHFGV